MPASVSTTARVDVTMLVRVEAAWVIVVAAAFVKIEKTVATSPDSVESAVTVLYEVDRTVDVAALSVVAPERWLVLVIVV